jgi:AcrR family transcriptional regulator
MSTLIDPRVLEAGRRVLRDHGWGNTTAERIAEAAGISRVTLHRHGIKREHVLAALTEAAIGAYQQAMWPCLVTPGTGRERLTHALTALCEVAEAHLDVLSALRTAADAIFHETGVGPVDTHVAFTAPLERLLRDGAADGTLREVEDPHAQAVTLFNAAAGTYLHLRTGHRWPAQRAQHAIIELLLHGLAA